MSPFVGFLRGIWCINVYMLSFFFFFNWESLASVESLKSQSWVTISHAYPFHSISKISYLPGAQKNPFYFALPQPHVLFAPGYLVACLLPWFIWRDVCGQGRTRGEVGGDMLYINRLPLLLTLGPCFWACKMYYLLFWFLKLEYRFLHLYQDV